jgi:hypothetical protein
VTLSPGQLSILSYPRRAHAGKARGNGAAKRTLAGKVRGNGPAKRALAGKLMAAAACVRARTATAACVRARTATAARGRGSSLSCVDGGLRSWQLATCVDSGMSRTRNTGKVRQAAVAEAAPEGGAGLNTKPD